MDNDAYKELLHEVQQLMGAGSPRRALEEVLVALDRNPDDANVLLLAQIVAHQSRTTQIKVVEPIPPEYLNDRRLDPIVAMCAVCGATWIPRPDLGFAKIGALNPIGAHCPKCNLVFCRNCFAKRPRGESLKLEELEADISCPICGGELTLPVKPTGRRARQLSRQRGRVLDFVVLREGFIRPDPEYLSNLVRYLSPDVLDTKDVGLHAHAVPPGSAKDMVGLMHAILTRIRLESYPDRQVETEVAQASDRDGEIVVIGKLFSPADAPASESPPKPTGDHRPSRTLHRIRRWFRRR